MNDSKLDIETAPQMKGPAAPMPATPARQTMSPTIKAALDFAPVLVFFVTYFVTGKHAATGAQATATSPGLMWATGVFMAATLVSLAITYVIERKVHIVPVVTAVIVLVFGGLTLLLHDERFIKMKPTIIYVLMAATLLGGLAFNKLFIKKVLGSAFDLTEAGWRALTLRWGLFFIALAILNEVLRRVLSTDNWVIFKVWGFMGIVVVFSLWQAVVVSKRQGKSEKAGE